MTQKKIDDLFSLTSTRSSSKRSRINQPTQNTNDEFNDLFETKRRRTSNTKPITDVFDFDAPSSTATNFIQKPENDRLAGSLKKKRSFGDDNKDFDELFNNDTRKKLRRPIKQEESMDILDMFNTKPNPNIPQTITTLDDFKTPISSKKFTTQKKIKMFFDDTDLTSLREQNDDIKDYVHIKPVLITSGQWLSKEAETKSTCDTMESSDNIPDEERNLMHIQYAPLIMDDEITSNKKTKNISQIRQPNKTILDGKSFRKQLVLSDSTILRKENLQSCYNALLEDINKPRILTKQTKSSKFNDDDDDEQIDNVDFFDLPSRKKKF